MRFEIQYLYNHIIKTTIIEASSKQEASSTFWDSGDYPVQASILGIQEVTDSKIIKG